MTADEKRAKVITAITKYDDMVEIVKNTSEKVKAQYDKLTAPRTPANDGMPRVHNPHAGEERLVNGLDLIQSIQERYKYAQIFVDWFVHLAKLLF